MCATTTSPSISHNVPHSVCHVARDVDFSNVVSIVRDVLKIETVVANLHYCIELILKASITMTVPHSIIHCPPVVVTVADTVAVVIASPLYSMSTKMSTTTTTTNVMTTNSPTTMKMNVWGTTRIVLKLA